MQTFLPYKHFDKSAKTLDLRRLGKQIIECRQINKALLDPDYGWQNHPAVNMWRGYQPALFWYAAEMHDEWIDRRGKTHKAFINMVGDDNYNYSLMIQCRQAGVLDLPPFIGDEQFHRSHRSNLLRKDAEHYGPHFEGGLSDSLEYVWPVRA